MPSRGLKGARLLPFAYTLQQGKPARDLVLNRGPAPSVSTRKDHMTQKDQPNPGTELEGASLLTVAQSVLSNSQLWNHKKLPFKARLYPGNERLVFMAGPNATGKSFLSKIIKVFAHKHYKASLVCVSMEERTGSGYNGMSPLRRAVMFGDEAEQSTGATSVKTLFSAFNTVRERVKEGRHPFLLLDEPEVGLSEGYEYALGQLIARKTLDLADGVCGTLVVSHSKSLAAGLIDGLQGNPSFIHTGEPGRDLAEWLAFSERFTVDQLEELAQRGLEHWREVSAIIDSL